MTELFLLKTPPKLFPPFLPSSSSETKSWEVVGLSGKDGGLEVGFCGGKERRSTKSMDLEFVVLLLKNFIFGYPFMFFLGEEEEEVDIYVKTMEDMCNGVSVMKAKDGWGREMWMRVVAIEG